MILTIDASSTKTGGALTHLISLVSYNQELSKFKKIFIYAPTSTLKKIRHHPKLIKKTHFLINQNIILRLLWQIFFLKNELNSNKSNCLFVTCGYYFIDFKPTIIIPQNFLPLDNVNLKNYIFSFGIFRLIFLRIFILNSLKRASGVILLNSFLKKILKNKFKINLKRVSVVPHGIEKLEVKNDFKGKKKIIYVSDFELYKNHFYLIKAIQKIKNQINLTCVGNFNGLRSLKNKLDDHNLDYSKIKFKKKMKRSKLLKFIRKHDIFIFNSSCENFAITLLEGMSLKMPIICSNLEPMKSIISDGGILTNPFDPVSIKNNILKFLNSEKLRKKKAYIAYKRSSLFSEKKMVTKTMSFLLKFRKFSQ